MKNIYQKNWLEYLPQLYWRDAFFIHRLTWRKVGDMRNEIGRTLPTYPFIFLLPQTVIV